MSQRVLICDDEAHIRRAVEMKLRRCGFEVDTACDGEDGWEKLSQNPPDLLITDLQMPRLDGMGLCKRIADSASHAFPVVLLTAKGFEIDRDEALSCFGVDVVIDKPFSPRELAEVVTELLAAATAN